MLKGGCQLNFFQIIHATDLAFKLRAPNFQLYWTLPLRFFCRELIAWQFQANAFAPSLRAIQNNPNAQT